MQEKFEGTIKDYDNFKEVISSQPVVEREELSLLQIAGISQLERIYHNFYKIYLTKIDDNPLASILMTSLCELINRKNSKKIKLKNWIIKSEAATPKGNRLDLLVIGKDSLRPCNILIEIKIKAGLYNDLADYWHAYGSADSVGIVLSLKNEILNTPNFINITHGEWFEKIKESYNKQEKKLPEKEEFIFQEFIRSIELHYKYTNVKNIDLQFYQENHKTISKLRQFRDEIMSKVDSGLKALGKKIGKEIGYINPSKDLGYDEGFLFLETNKKQHIGIDLTIENLEKGLFWIGFNLFQSSMVHYDEIIKSNRLEKLKSEKGLIVGDGKASKYASIYYKEYGVDDLIDIDDFEKSFIHLYETEWKEILEIIKEELLKVKKS